ncbi:MAG: hypothetical protein GYA59_00885, partial [Chloroflexi bacterium]|nr:hypothetical protein [Chloroflexota bacterium]
MKRTSRFSILACGLLVYNIAVILWGAFVRATGSGAGCGAHWPLCNGAVVPRAPQIETVIEFVHRISSGLTLPLVIVLVVWAWRIYPRRHPVRWSSALVVGFTLSEALLGAGLVLFELVAHNASAFRALAMVLHLVNTFLLLGALALTAWWASQGAPGRFGWNGLAGWLVATGILGMVVLGASGAITALGDTLFPVGSLSEGIRQDFSATAHFLIRLRVFHPVIAVAVGLYLIFLANWLKERIKDSRAGRLASLLVGLVVAQLLLGVTNLM